MGTGATNKYGIVVPVRQTWRELGVRLMRCVETPTTPDLMLLKKKKKMMMIYTLMHVVEDHNMHYCTIN